MKSRVLKGWMKVRGLVAKIYATGRRGMPRAKWIGQVVEERNVMTNGCLRMGNLCEETVCLEAHFGGAKAHPGLKC